MRKSVKIMGLAALAAALVVIGGYSGAPSYTSLKANFMYDAGYEILNDSYEYGEFAYIDAGRLQASPWVKFEGDGHLRMAIARNALTGRYVHVLLNNIDPAPTYLPDTNCAKYAVGPTLPDLMQWFWLTSGAEVSDTDGDGIMETGGAPLNLKAMAVDEVKYCTLACDFQTFDNQCEYDWGRAPDVVTADTLVKVEVMLENGVKVWLITPYAVPGQDCSQRKLYRLIYTKKSGAGYGGTCDAGAWDADFALKLALK